MLKKFLVGGLLASAVIVPALAQSAPPAATQAPTTMTSTTAHSDMWRSSKLIGVNVYNDNNDKLGDISELLLDKSGKVAGVIIGVGGFLGMGQHDIMVEMSKLKFVDDPAPSSSTSTSSATGAAQDTRATTTSSSTSRDKWYPDHAVLSGATKDSLKGMQEFKY